jgi:hypothetical protein
MSDDLKERLRHHEREYPLLIHGPLCGEAADEIERLEAETEWLHAAKEAAETTAAALLHEVER